TTQDRQKHFEYVFIRVASEADEQLRLRAARRDEQLATPTPQKGHVGLDPARRLLRTEHDRDVAVVHAALPSMDGPVTTSSKRPSGTLAATLMSGGSRYELAESGSYPKEVEKTSMIV